MKRFILVIIVVLVCVIRASAAEFQAPTVPYSAEQYFPEDAESFSEGLWYILQAAMEQLQPAITNALRTCARLLAVTMVIAIPETLRGNRWYTDLVGVLISALTLIGTSEDLVSQALTAINELCEYGKLLLPVMTGALAAQGAISTATALCTGTMVFISILSLALHNLFIPAVYIYLALSIGSNALGNKMLLQLQDFSKWCITWILKLSLYLFTGYLSITGVVSGSIDAQTLKATKLTISGFVPVIGNILSDASEAVLVSTALVKNAAGIYGLLAIIAVGIGPFLNIALQSLMLRITAGICAIFGNGANVKLIKDISVCMGFLVAMTATVTILLLVSTVCFMKGGA